MAAASPKQLQRSENLRPSVREKVLTLARQVGHSLSIWFQAEQGICGFLQGPISNRYMVISTAPATLSRARLRTTLSQSDLTHTDNSRASTPTKPKLRPQADMSASIDSLASGPRPPETSRHCLHLQRFLASKAFPFLIFSPR